VNPTQFALDAQSLARRAAGLALENRARFIDLPSTTDFLTSQKPRPGYFWDNYHAGIAAGQHIRVVTQVREASHIHSCERDQQR